VASRPVSSSKIAPMGPSTSFPSPADQGQSVAANRNPLSFRSARHGNRSGQTRSAAAIAAAVAVARQTEAAVEAESARHLGRAGAAQLRRALTRLREITDPYA